jgi:inner membrane protein
MENNNLEKETENSTFQNRTMIKGFLVGVLTLCLLIPIPFILNLIEEREQNKEKVMTELTNKWSEKQTVYGPFIEITHLEKQTDDKGKTVSKQQKTYISADNLNIKGSVNAQLKNRSIYDVTVYTTKLNLESKFKNFQEILKNSEIDANNIISTKLIFGITDSKGYESNVIAKSGGKNYPLIADNQIFYTPEPTPAVTSENSYDSTPTKENKTVTEFQLLSQKIDIETFNFNKVTIQLSAKGSQLLNFIPSGINTYVNLTTNWKDLKYDGNFLPNETPIYKDGKTNIVWSIYQQNPLQGQIWKDASNFSNYSFGVNFLQMNDHYEKTYRSTKYAILFISLTFAAFFFIEIKNRFNIHLVQYALVGIAICVNFVLLISLSEYIGFDYSYLISSGATILLITFFINTFLQSYRLTFKISLMLILLYSFIYSLLQLKEHALLVGSIGLFIIVAIIMYYSKNIEWNKVK